MDSLKRPVGSRLAVAVSLLFVALVLCWGKLHYGNVKAGWELLQVPAMSPRFVDARAIGARIDCLKEGEDPYLTCKNDPFGRPANYPPIWLDFRYLGVGVGSTDTLGVIFGVMMALALISVFRANGWISGALVFFAAISPPVLLAVERGNNDVVVFSLLVLGSLFAGLQSVKRRPWLFGLQIVLLTVLKIFPLVTAVALLRDRRSIWLATSTAIFSLLALVLTCGHRLGAILANTPQDVNATFGSHSLFFHLVRHLHGHGGVLMHRYPGILGAITIALFALTAGVLGRKRLHLIFPQLDLINPRGFIAASGLAIYCLIFLLGSSYYYRLIFLVGVVPYLIEDLNLRKSLRSLPATILLLLYLYSPIFQHALTGEFLDLLIFFGACIWLVSTVVANLMTGVQPEQLPAPTAL